MWTSTYKFKRMSFPEREQTPPFFTRSVSWFLHDADYEAAIKERCYVCPRSEHIGDRTLTPEQHLTLPSGMRMCKTCFPVYDTANEWATHNDVSASRPEEHRFSNVSEYHLAVTLHRNAKRRLAYKERTRKIYHTADEWARDHVHTNPKPKTNEFSSEAQYQEALAMHSQRRKEYNRLLHARADVKERKNAKARATYRTKVA